MYSTVCPSLLEHARVSWITLVLGGVLVPLVLHWQFVGVQPGLEGEAIATKLERLH